MRDLRRPTKITHCPSCGKKLKLCCNRKGIKFLVCKVKGCKQKTINANYHRPKSGLLLVPSSKKIINHWIPDLVNPNDIMLVKQKKPLQY